MVNKKPRKKHIPFKSPIPGASPGFYTIEPNALTPKITVHTYAANYYKRDNISIESLDFNQLISKADCNYWIDIKGFGSAKIFNQLEQQLNINRLVLEDATSSNHRPKYDEYDSDGYAYAVSRFLYIDENEEIKNEQINFLITKNCLISLQETYQCPFEPVVRRLEVGKGNIRSAGSSYLLYALMDVIVDNYFVLLNKLGEELDEIEERLFEKPDKRIMYDTQLIKKQLMSLRKVVWPERDKLNDILRTDSPLISNLTKTYIKDAYDHSIQIIDIIESLKEIAASNIDLNLSITSNRMNEIMKVLTIISSIFIPLTFIAGIYGMNFSSVNPKTGVEMPLNMPELYFQHGYIYILLIMLIIGLIQIVYFWRKGWFR